MAITGDPGGPPLAPPTAAATDLDRLLAPFRLGAEVLAERAAILGLRRGGTRSCGGATALLRAADGWVAVALAREDDIAALPAVLEVAPDALPAPGPGHAPWDALARAVAERPAEELVERGRLLAVPIARVGERSARFTATCTRPGPGRTGVDAPAPRVLDLSALWAGPLAAACLLRSGADVVKVEDVNRPDGARRGNPAFFDLLNTGKRSVALDLSEPAGRDRLRHLVDAADIVVSSSRARALDQLGLDPSAFLAGGTDRIWIAVSGYGLDVDRVGFGDDAAAAAGLVAWHPDGAPRFAADAVADPLCGAQAAAAARDAWAAGGRWLMDASLT
ncbi:MAG: CoA transferase, partial [Acidimicrobiales bacterium]|nr:CoA transferase [Acidimicrobiales bacterium]